MTVLTIKFEFCRFCKAQDILPVTVTEDHGPKRRINFHCPECGEVMAVAWTKKKAGDNYLPRK